jgi:hypothetical protein
MWSYHLNFDYYYDNNMDEPAEICIIFSKAASQHLLSELNCCFQAHETNHLTEQQLHAHKLPILKVQGLF